MIASVQPPRADEGSSERLGDRDVRVLAEEKQVPIEIDPSMPYLATALIQEVGA